MNLLRGDCTYTHTHTKTKVKEQWRRTVHEHASMVLVFGVLIANHLVSCGVTHTKSKPPNITLLLLLEKWSVSAMARGWKRQEGRRTTAWAAAAKTWFLVWLLIWLGFAVRLVLVCISLCMAAKIVSRGNIAIFQLKKAQEGKASLRSTGHNSTMRSSQGKGRSEKGQDFPPSLQKSKQTSKQGEDKAKARSQSRASD